MPPGLLEFYDASATASIERTSRDLHEGVTSKQGYVTPCADCQRRLLKLQRDQNSSKMQRIARSCAKTLQRIAKEQDALNAQHLASAGPAVRLLSAVPEQISGMLVSPSAPLYDEES